MTPLPDRYCPVDGVRIPGDSLAWCCPSCHGPLELDFSPTPAPLKSLTGRVNSLWRYAETLPLASPSVSLGEGRTPLVPLTDTVSAKLDFLMPTLSFKDRGAVLLAELARRIGPRRVVADSSGNAGTAIAAYCARAGLACTVYVPLGTSAKKLEQIEAHGARAEEVDGGREAAGAAARRAADEPDTFYASHVFNPYFLHGTKTYVHELWEDMGGRLPDVLVLPVGNGTLLLGAALAVAELYGAGLLDKRPALWAVQAAAVAPLAEAWERGADEPTGTTPVAPTYAEGIAIPRPPRARQILRAVRDSGGTFLTVTEDRIRHAQADLASRGLYVEATAAVCWAAVREGALAGRSAVVPLCGAGLKSGLAR
ncbi:pyridoxal-phosphate dependent enzyme [Streptomyces thermodiastaticus]|jgi:threonine synthase|uniref:pyridoxal-phosphate dependent enzyme n=1 Tax=Streptomyces thermodiastaticus TaxID=44061 RepID=UPI00167C31C1|nr:pyridoxal-phosphate dependent enzyme [Streptomyces thermodiastaticus]MCE7549992.1 pyridoxal-phosphate dependent enzyme [Streptomyces thermodiastaticus]GHF64603.1 threonine synthase [Streptomyces thermodiastaticus]